MVFFLIIVLTIIAIVYLFRTGESRTYSNSIGSSYSTEPIYRNLENDGPLLYKNKGIKSFGMKGMYYRDLVPEIHVGEFIGYAQCEDNSHDQYAVGIFNGKSEHLGYTPRGNKRLNNSLLEWNQGKVPAWGTIYYDAFDDRWSGQVYIPVGFNKEQIEKFELVLKQIDQNRKRIKKNEKSTEDYFEIIAVHKKIQELLAELRNPQELNYSFPKNLIPALSNHLEKEKDWTRLVELEKHEELIYDLNERFRETTLNRIRKAKKLVKPNF